MHFHRRCHFLWLAWRIKVSAVPEPMHPVDDSFCRHRFRERNHIDEDWLIDVVIEYTLIDSWSVSSLASPTWWENRSQASKLLKVLLLSLIFQTSAWRMKLLFSWLCLGNVLGRGLVDDLFDGFRITCLKVVFVWGIGVPPCQVSQQL
jgi:hypothetical protein